MEDYFANKWCINFALEGHEVRVYGNLNAKTPLPVVYMHTIADEGRAIWESCREKGLPPFVLAEIAVPDWHGDMSPWAGPSLTKRGEPFAGGADAYLPVLERIMAKVERMFDFKPLWRGLVGYSMAGLFALYTLYRTDVFDRIASVSGSLWYWGFVDYVSEHTAVNRPQCIYMSLGDKEGQVKDDVLNTVEPYTGRIYVRLSTRGQRVAFERNEGNHFHEPEARVVKAVVFLLAFGE